MERKGREKVNQFEERPKSDATGDLRSPGECARSDFWQECGQGEKIVTKTTRKTTTIVHCVHVYEYFSGS